MLIHDNIISLLLLWIMPKKSLTLVSLNELSYLFLRDNTNFNFNSIKKYNLKNKVIDFLLDVDCIECKFDFPQIINVICLTMITI